MSGTMVLAPIVRALVGAEDVLGENRTWNSVNSRQEEFLNKYFSTREELVRYSKEELRHWVSWVAAELNKILEKEGFDIRLDDFNPNEFGVVSILDVMVEWLVEGEKDTLLVDGVEYPAVKMKREITLGEGGLLFPFGVYSAPGHSYPVAMLYTKSGDKLYMTVAENPAEGFELVSRVDEIRSNLEPSHGYNYVRFPMVDLNQEVDIGWLKGMRTTVESSGDEAVISQALQQTKFKMNQHGARVKSAVAIKARTISIPRPPRELVIDEPFYLWIEREGVSVPVMYAYIDQENWKNPGSLSDM